MRKQNWLIVGLVLALCAAGNTLAQTLGGSGGQTGSATVFVTVTDATGRLVTGLESKHFEVLENGVPRPLTFLSDADAPLSIGVAVHTSGSLQGRLDGVRAALKQFTEQNHPASEFFVVSHASLPEAVALANARLSRSRYARRALLVLTDGQGQTSFTPAAPAGVQIFCIGLSEAASFPAAQQAALYELAQLNGGTAAFPGSASELANAFARIALEVRHQYRLGYTPLNAAQRNVQVSLHPPRGLPALTLRVNYARQ